MSKDSIHLAIGTFNSMQDINVTEASFKNEVDLM